MASPGSSGSGGGSYKFPVPGRFQRAPSCNEILPRLYLGDICVATNKDEISRLGITDMITIEIKPLQASDLASCVKRYLYINVMDHSKQDILSHFETSNEFIESALKSATNKVYVHCVAGISRSATLVIAYIMKTRSMNYTEAYELVQTKRRVVDPNEGFVRQLVLYHKMRYLIDIGNIEYRRMVLEALVFEFRLISLSYYQIQTSKTSSAGLSAAASTSDGLVPMAPHANKQLPNRNNVGILFDQYYNKLHLQQVSKHPEVYEPQTAFRCNKCRTIVFYAISVIENKIPGSLTARLSKLESPAGRRPTSVSSVDYLRQQQQQPQLRDKPIDCPFVFIEPQPWMSRNVLERDGNLDCYKCKRKLGKFDWTSGESCSCALHNSHMNFNLFKIMKKKVDSS